MEHFKRGRGSTLVRVNVVYKRLQTDMTVTHGADENTHDLSLKTFLTHFFNNWLRGSTSTLCNIIVVETSLKCILN